MILIKDKVLIPANPRRKPTRFRFKGKIRIGFRNNKVVEVVQFKEVKRKRK